MLLGHAAAFFVLVPQQAGLEPQTLAQVIRGIIVGIGFLGAGAILKLPEDREIQGLTTAASIWLTAAVGVSAGAGQLTSALFTTFLALLVLAVFPRSHERHGA